MTHPRQTLTTAAALAVAALTLGAAAQEVSRLPPPAEAAPPVTFDPPAPLRLTPAPAPATGEPEALETPPADSPLDAAATLIDEPIEQRWYAPMHWIKSPEWDVGFELGLNGSSGSSDSLSTRVGGYVKHDSKATKLDASIYHNRTKSDGRETQNNALLDVRHDWKLHASPLSLFVMNQTFYDEFQAYDINTNVTSGLGFQVVDADYLKFSTRFGAGASREFGGVHNDWVPEAQAGLNWDQPIYDAHKFSVKMDYYPEWGDFNRYRLLTEIGWQVALSQPSNVSLKFSASDRFDSRPEGVNPHVTNYSVLLLWKH